MISSSHPCYTTRASPGILCLAEFVSSVMLELLSCRLSVELSSHPTDGSAVFTLSRSACGPGRSPRACWIRLPARCLENRAADAATEPAVSVLLFAMPFGLFGLPSLQPLGELLTPANFYSGSFFTGTKCSARLNPLPSFATLAMMKELQPLLLRAQFRPPPAGQPVGVFLFPPSFSC